MVRNLLLAISVLSLVIPAGSPRLCAQTEQRRILLEEFSTAQCGFCPDGDVIAARIVKDHPSVIWVTHHAGFGVDSMTAPFSNEIARAFVNFAPSGVIDRVAYPHYVAPYDNLGTIRAKWDSLITAHLDDEQYADIQITSTCRASTGQLDCAVGVTFTTLPAPGELRLHLFVVEDSIIGAGKGYDQTNYYNATPGHPFYQAGDPILGYAHHRVVSAIPTGAWGVTGVIPSSPETGKTYTWNWTGNLNDIWDPGNFGRHDLITLVAFVSAFDDDPFRRPVVHAAEAHITNVVLGAETMPQPSDALRIDTYPNPASYQVTISASMTPAESGMLIVTDVAGREIARRELSADRPRCTLPVSSLPSGLYFTRLLTGRRIASDSFIVRH